MKRETEHAFQFPSVLMDTCPRFRVRGLEGERLFNSK